MKITTAERLDLGRKISSLPSVISTQTYGELGQLEKEELQTLLEELEEIRLSTNTVNSILRSLAGRYSAAK